MVLFIVCVYYEIYFINGAPIAANFVPHQNHEFEYGSRYNRRNLRIMHFMINQARLEAIVLSHKELLTNIALVCQMFSLNIKVFIFNNISISMKNIYCSSSNEKGLME